MTNVKWKKKWKKNEKMGREGEKADKQTIWENEEKCEWIQHRN